MVVADYFERDSRLKEVDTLAKDLYKQAELTVHNYDHALWDTVQIVRIGEVEGHRDISLPIAAGLMHDSGVSRGPYKDHSINGGRNVREYLPKIGFNQNDTEEIAIAVEQHNGWQHTSDTAKFLFDADTLNKSGAHGFGQCMAVGTEFGFDLARMTERFLPYFTQLAEKGHYTNTAREIDREMGTDQLAGLELMSLFWKKSDEMLKQGTLKEEEIINKLREILKI